LKKVIFTTSVCMVLLCISYSYASYSKELIEAHKQYEKEHEIRSRIVSKLYISALKKFARALETRAQLHSVGLSTLAETAVNGSIPDFLVLTMYGIGRK
jgi:hypothetical protein